MRTAVMTDTNSGISVKEGRELGVFVLPMPVLIGGAGYTEGVDISSRQLFTALSQGVEASTSQPSPAAVTELWDGIFARGYEEIVHIPMTSGLSGSCESAMQLAQAYGGRGQVADNRRISLLQKASVLDAKYLADRGLSAAEVRARLEKNGPNAIVYIAVDTLEYLKKSGRVTAAAAAISTVMNIKPVLRIQGGQAGAGGQNPRYAAVSGKDDTAFAGAAGDQVLAVPPGEAAYRHCGQLRQPGGGERLARPGPEGLPQVQGPV